MFKRKAAQSVSVSRFCVRALELPYAHLYSYGQFVVAISHLSVARRWPADGTDDPVAYGVLHGSNTYPDRRAEEPVLPVQITFDRNPYKPERFGEAHFERASSDGPYILYVTISDSDGSIARAVATAMEHSVSSGYNFLHVRCSRTRSAADLANPAPKAQIQAEREFLKSVERGEAELGSIPFDKLFFDDQLTTKGPAWSWRWHEWEFDKPGLQSKTVARWRREWLPFRERQG